MLSRSSSKYPTWAYTNNQHVCVLDVQVTKDYVPVIYHDFLVAESGTDIGVHEVTFEQVNIAVSQGLVPVRLFRRFLG
jgi:hypothetical protein